MKNKKKILIIAGIVLCLIIILLLVFFIGKDKEKGGKCEETTGGSYTLKFETDSDNKIADMSVCIACSPDSYEELPVPTRDGFEFIGWYLDKDFIDKLDGKNTLDVTPVPNVDKNNCRTGYKDVTLYAKWIEKDKTVDVTKISVSESSVSLYVSGTTTIKTTIEPSNATDKSLTWESENSKVAVVDNSGKITAKSVGTTNIIVKSNNGVTAKVLVKVVEKSETSKTETKKEYTCPSGYTLNGTDCTKKESVKASSTACPSGTYEKNGKCYTVTNQARSDGTRTCGSKTINMGGGHTSEVQGVVYNAGTTFCAYGKVSDSYEQNQTNCTSRGHKWVIPLNGCYYEVDNNYKTTCPTGYEFIKDPMTDFNIKGTGFGGGCFPVTNKPQACPDSSYSIITDPYIGKMCTRTVTIKATLK